MSAIKTTQMVAGFAVPRAAAGAWVFVMANGCWPRRPLTLWSGFEYLRASWPACARQANRRCKSRQNC